MIKICTQFHKNISTVRLFATQINKEMKYLNVAEKNDAAKTIAGLLSSGAARRREGFSVYNKIYEFETPVRGTNSKMVMTSVSGHLLQLEFLVSYRSWKNCDPLQLFDAAVLKSCNEDYLPIKKTLEREIKSCQGLIVWTDCDREGENIGFEIIDVCKAIKPNISVYRAKFSEITSASVRRALANLAQPDKLQSDAVDVRSELDLRTGAAITRLQTMRLQRLFPEKIANKLISYGSCQIPTLGFVAERYKEVEAFISEPFWKIKVIHTIDDLTVDFNWARNRLFDKEACEDFLMLCLADPKATVENVTTKPKNKWRPTPLDTVEMEKLGSRKLKLSAKETMTIAEKLYTQGIISYPRTETNMFSKEIDLKNLVEQQLPHSVWGDFARRVIEWGPNPRNGNKSDQAHPPIHPTKLVTSLTGNEARVYELIVRHFLACVSKDATGSETIVNINIAGEKFTATGLCIYERNYLDVYIYDKWNAKQIHRYEIGQIFDPTDISMQEGATTAPPLLTEADLIALMEKHGIGTDATHAEHINTIKERGYIGEADRGSLVPGVIGMGLYEGYDAMELVLAKPMLRAAFEADLKEICLGNKDPKIVLRDQIQKYKEAYKVITDKIASMDEKMSLRINETPRVNTTNESAFANENRVQELFQCPKCLISHMGLRKKKDSLSYFIGCLNFPECKNVIWLSDELKEVSSTQENCRRCGTASKMLKVKLNSAYYRSLFDVPDGWYSTCLRCDSKFRETFNINPDLVKRVGAIVGDTPSNTNRGVRPTTNTITSGSAQNTNSRVTAPSSSSRPSARNKVQRVDHSDNDRARQTKLKKSTKLNPTTAGGSNIQQGSTRKFTIDSRVSTQTETTRQVEDICDFFDTNDGFDDMLSSAAFDAVINAPPPSVGTSETLNRMDDDLASLLMNDDFEEYSWGTAGRSDSSIRSEASKRTRVELEEIPRWGTETSQGTNSVACTTDSYEWGSSRSHQNNRIPAPRDTEQAYQWGSSGTQGNNRPDSARNQDETRQCGTQPISCSKDNTTVRCAGCHQLAKELTVKKEGPNKGRLFYACPKPNACKFFQWADVDTESEDNALQPRSANTEQFTRSLPESEIINCNCQIPASSLVVRKDGPNQGRSFYACANRNTSCGFFKWGDDNTRVDQNESSWGTNSAASSRVEQSESSWRMRNATNNSSSAVNRSSTSGRPPGVSQNDSKKRKCGICRQEGHTKAKCPHKNRFQI